jgi:hypothetical protein
LQGHQRPVGRGDDRDDRRELLTGHGGVPGWTWTARRSRHAGPERTSRGRSRGRA